jgi:hypothetical protein
VIENGNKAGAAVMLDPISEVVDDVIHRTETRFAAVDLEAVDGVLFLKECLFHSSPPMVSRFA